MTSQPISTTAEIAAPWVFVEVTDGRITTLQLDRTSLDRDREPDLADAVTRATNTALTRQVDDLLTSPDEVDAARDRVLTFLGTVLGDTPSPSGTRSRDGEPTASETTARVVDGVIEALWIDPTLLDRSRPFDAENAIRVALNDALERYETTFVDAVAAVDPTDQSPSWDALALDVDRIERGLL
ncbi:hypothetical protein SAMN02745244_03680 [Tessaracoccus bendigoensis DSM 12906]|uniref:Uncharacterized protein n=1 Tax=Tessaracoccus bendigoensis DSM 12906 TaxID=1123357 RepID=A0A1M6NNP0_9ACTN|nr:hypothetical protein [Tessaracoccus bendigoensis]SHJ97305.1 hypothetical protein SAMN02745244_03680 [Tessaracoccus bendigoensis DSM 12906]